MKRWKKPLSVLLAVVMALSSMTVAFNVFAADRPLNTVEEIKKAIADDYEKGDGFPKLEADLRDAYKKLSNDDKDGLGAQTLAKLFRMSYLLENSGSGTTPEKAERAFTNLGGFTPRQKQAYDYAVAFSDASIITVDGKEVISRLTSYKFSADYSSGSGAAKVVYSRATQKAHFESVVPQFKAMVQSADAFVYELANCLNASISGTGSNAVGYVYANGSLNLNAFNNMIKAALLYADEYKRNDANQVLTPSEKQKYVIELLGLDQLGSSFDVLSVMKDYSGQTYQEALALYLKDKKANRDAFVNTVKPAYDKTIVNFSLEKSAAANTVAIIIVKDSAGKESLTTVNALWQPVADNYTALIVIEDLAKVDVSKLLTKEDVDKATAGYSDLTSAAKKIVDADKTSKDKYDSIVKTGKDIDTAAFRKMVVDYVIPEKITDANKDAVVAFVNSCEAAYNALSYTLKNYVRDSYPAINTKYAEILDLRNLLNVSSFVNTVDAFDLKAEQGSDLNKQIQALRDEYSAFTAALKTYIKDKQQATYNKYNQILQCWTFIPGDDLHGSFQGQTVQAELPDPLNTVVYETLVPQLENLLSSFLPSLTGSANVQELLESQFTNESVTAFVKMIYPAFYDIVQKEAGMGGLMNTTPSKVGAKLEYDEDENIVQFKNAKETLAKYTTMESWADVPSDMDWGVIPGDYETFINALLGSLVGVSTSMSIGSAIMTMLKDTFVGSYTKTPGGAIDKSSFEVGAWDYFIVPLLEALGVSSEHIMDNVAYALYVEGDNTIRGYLKPVTDILYYNLIPEVSKAPVDYVLTNLPNLVYHLEDGCLMNGLNETLNHLNMTVLSNVVDIKAIIMNLFADADGNVPTELSVDLVFDMLAPTLSGIGLDLTLEDLYQIGYLGKAEKVDTSRISVEKAVKIVADKDSVINYVLNFVNDLLPGLGLDFAVKGEFVKTEAPNYPHNGKMDKKVMNAAVDGLDALLGSFINIKDLINNGLCTNEMAANAMTGIYSALAPTLSAIGIDVTPKAVAAMMHEDRYADLRVDLALDSWSDVGLVLKNEAEVVYQTNMGFKNGDRDGFVACVVAMLRPLVKALADNNLVVNTDISKGLYETLIIPMFEALGLTPAVDSAAYTENYRLLSQKTDKTAAYDYLVKTILSPVLGLLNDLQVAPAKTLMKLLPNLAYAIQYNPTLAFIGNLLEGQGGLTGVLNGLLGGMIEGFTLPELPMNALASCGTLVEKTSKRITQDKYTVVAADTADAFVTVYYYLYDAVNNGNNLQLLKDLVADLEMDDALKGVVDNVLNEIFTASKEESLCKMGELLASDVWACPDGDGNGGKKTPSTGDYAIPAAVFLSMMVGAGAVIVLMRKKRERVSD